MDPAATDAGDSNSRAGVAFAASAADISADAERAGEPGDPAEPMTHDISALTAASRQAIEQFEIAKATGSPSAIGEARLDLHTLMAKLKAAKADIVLENAMSKALRAPVRLTR